MTFALPPLDQWPDLAEADAEILSPGTADPEGRWRRDCPFVLRIRRHWTLLAEPGFDGILLRDAVLRPHPEGMAWAGSNHIGSLACHPDEREVERAESGTGPFRRATIRVLPPRAPSPDARRRVLLKALSRAIGPASRQRLDAFRTFARARLLAEGARSGILRPLLPGGPRLLVHKPDGTTSAQALFRRGDGGKRPLPDAAALLLGGDCRQIVGDPGGEFLRPCEELRIRIDEIPSRHAVLAAAEDAISRFDALDVDVRPWIVRRTR